MGGRQRPLGAGGGGSSARAAEPPTPGRQARRRRLCARSAASVMRLASRRGEQNAPLCVTDMRPQSVSGAWRLDPESHQYCRVLTMVGLWLPRPSVPRI